MDTRQTKRRFWLIAQDFITTLFNLFGAPQEIAAQHTYVRDDWRLVAKCLGAGEANAAAIRSAARGAVYPPNTS